MRFVVFADEGASEFDRCGRMPAPDLYLTSFVYFSMVEQELLKNRGDWSWEKHMTKW